MLMRVAIHPSICGSAACCRVYHYEAQVPCTGTCCGRGGRNDGVALVPAPGTKQDVCSSAGRAASSDSGDTKH